MTNYNTSAQLPFKSNTDPDELDLEAGSNSEEEQWQCPLECGETKPMAPAKPENLTWGIDTRPLLPLGLASSTVMGMLFVLLLEIPLLCRYLHFNMTITMVFGVGLYTTILGTMVYTAFHDPGQLSEEQVKAVVRVGEDSDDGNPKRAHNSWQYNRPIRRYDHYCRWLTNGIGLWNHRQFFVMLLTLILSGVLGLAGDLVLMLVVFLKGSGDFDMDFWATQIALAAHAGYNIGLLMLGGPILKIHIGLVSRNELAHEWKSNESYIVRTESGTIKPVNELSDDEFNQHFERFEYVKEKNKWDRGLAVNCNDFWCHERGREELGEF